MIKDLTTIRISSLVEVSPFFFHDWYKRQDKNRMDQAIEWRLEDGKFPLL